MSSVGTPMSHAPYGVTGEVYNIRAVARWCESLHCEAPLVDALSAVATAVGANAVALGRSDGTSHMPSAAVVFDRRTEDRLAHVFGVALFAETLRNAKAGSLWFRSEIGGGIGLPALDALWARRGWDELAVIVLARTDTELDLLECHISRTDAARHRSTLSLLSETLAETWVWRRPGLLSGALSHDHAPVETSREDQPLLSYENPARLSRAEFRVCLLLADRLTVDDVRRELGISMTTLRTHLRNIYTKTGVAGQGHLISRLQSETHGRAKHSLSGPLTLRGKPG